MSIRLIFQRLFSLEGKVAFVSGDPEDLVGAAIWLCSPGSSYVTGQVIAVDDGFTAGGSGKRRSLRMCADSVLERVGVWA
jgi:Enoyl-(Acyl carrier protein) reductase